MALDQEYFDSIHIDLVKKKYYNANKVEAVFRDIREQALALNRENEILRSRLNELSDKKERIGDAILSATAVSQELVSKAEKEADAILAEAERKRAELLADARRQQEYAVSRVEGCYSRMREQHMACIEAINNEWQSFLCDLFPEEEAPSLEEEANAPAEEQVASDAADAPAELPAEFGKRLEAIAQELFDMELPE